MSYLEQLIRSGAAEGLQINIWPCDAGYQGNVRERGGSGWTVEVRPDPVDAVQAALSARLTKLPTRHVVSDEEQLDIEDAIAATTGTRCGDCGKPQFDTPSGVTCENGHGGANAVDSDDFEDLL